MNLLLKVINWCLRRFTPTPAGVAFGSYCERVVNKTLKNKVDNYENFIADDMEKLGCTRYEAALRTLVFFKMVEYANAIYDYDSDTSDYEEE